MWNKNEHGRSAGQQPEHKDLEKSYWGLIVGDNLTEEKLEHWNSITEPEAGFVLIKYASLSEIEAELTQGSISKCRPYVVLINPSLTEIEAGSILGIRYTFMTYWWKYYNLNWTSSWMCAMNFCHMLIKMMLVFWNWSWINAKNSCLICAVLIRMKPPQISVGSAIIILW